MNHKLAGTKAKLSNISIKILDQLLMVMATIITTSQCWFRRYLFSAEKCSKSIEPPDDLAWNEIKYFFQKEISLNIKRIIA